MSLGNCRLTVEHISKARESLIEAVDCGQWLNDRTLSRLTAAVRAIAAAEYHADRELHAIERRRMDEIAERREREAQ